MAAYRQLHSPNARAVSTTFDRHMLRHVHGHGHVHGPGDAVSESLRDVWHQLVSTMFDSYHPERHYMRGPGPACAAKRRGAK